MKEKESRTGRTPFFMGFGLCTKPCFVLMAALPRRLERHLFRAPGKLQEQPETIGDD
jgi:hypothetical protein